MSAGGNPHNVVCPRCDSAEGDPCFSVGHDSYSRGAPLKRAHPERYKAASAEATAATPPRPAEEIAREMVPEPYSMGTYTPRTHIDRAGRRVVVLLEREGDANVLRGMVAAIIEQGRADGEAAERERLSAHRHVASGAPSVDAFAVAAFDVVRAHVPDPWVDDVFAELTRRFQEMTAQPATLADALMALFLEYAGRWAEACVAEAYSSSEASSIRCRDLHIVMGDIRDALVDVAIGYDLDTRIRILRNESASTSASLLAARRQAAADLESLISRFGGAK